ncbi:MAG: hypothetical protein Q7K98_00260 [Candidatus Omnitrophota bacterium]|nr:hypothetical protein [Candidatus Omnitrophota bacterium]
MSKRNLRGQSTLEYVILAGFVVAALIAMGVYMKRGFQGRLRESTDQVGQQYSAEHTTSTYTTRTDVAQTETLNASGITTTNITKNTQSRTGSEKVEGLSAK